MTKLLLRAIMNVYSWTKLLFGYRQIIKFAKHNYLDEIYAELCSETMSPVYSHVFHYKELQTNILKILAHMISGNIMLCIILPLWLAYIIITAPFYMSYRLCKGTIISLDVILCKKTSSTANVIESIIIIILNTVLTYEIIASVGNLIYILFTRYLI